MSLFELFLRFLYVGLFTIGGGLASIPLMLQAIVGAGLITEEMFYNMIGISESTPGAIGVNLATYIGFEQYGVLGGIVTTLGLILPCFCISFAVSKAFQRVSEAPAVKAAFYGIRAVVVGLIATAAWGVMRVSLTNAGTLAENGVRLLDWKAILIFAVLLVFQLKFQKHPILVIALGGLAGVLLL